MNRLCILNVPRYTSEFMQNIGSHTRMSMPSMPSMYVLIKSKIFCFMLHETNKIFSIFKAPKGLADKKMSAVWTK